MKKFIHKTVSGIALLNALLISCFLMYGIYDWLNMERLIVLGGLFVAQALISVVFYYFNQAKSV